MKKRKSLINPAKAKKIPPPPGPNVPWAKQAAYFEKYSSAELEAAGYGRELTPKEKREFKQLEQSIKARLAKHGRTSKVH